MFTTQRDMSLVRKLNRELMGNIITQQCSVYQFKLEETKVNLYVAVVAVVVVVE